MKLLCLFDELLRGGQITYAMKWNVEKERAKQLLGPHSTSNVNANPTGNAPTLTTNLIYSFFLASSQIVLLTTRACPPLLQLRPSHIICLSLILYILHLCDVIYITCSDMILWVFVACYWIYCGEGTCTKNLTYTHTCQCKTGYYNLLNVSAFPCYSDCAVGSDCEKLGIKVSNSTSSDNNNRATSFLPGKFNWILIISLMSIAMALWK
ncbi:hypothetical protein C3L33_18457, partial [Rhododendron williamsianum]